MLLIQKASIDVDSYNARIQKDPEAGFHTCTLLEREGGQGNRRASAISIRAVRVRGMRTR